LCCAWSGAWKSKHIVLVRSMCLHGISRLFAEILRVSSTLPMCLQVSTFLHCGFTAFSISVYLLLW
jgi:hypothetical protein